MAEREVVVPDIGEFEDVDVIEVLVAPGDRVEADQSLVTLESDKATMEIPAPFAGVVKELLVAVGDKVSEGSRLALLDAAGAEAPAVEPAPVERAEAPPAVAAAPAPQAAPAQPAPASPAQGDEGVSEFVGADRPGGGVAAVEGVGGESDEAGIGPEGVAASEGLGRDPHVDRQVETRHAGLIGQQHARGGFFLNLGIVRRGNQFG